MTPLLVAGAAFIPFAAGVLLGVYLTHRDYRAALERQATRRRHPSALRRNGDTDVIQLRGTP